MTAGVVLWDNYVYQGVFLWTLGVCTLGFWVPKPGNMALNKGIWDPKLRGTNIKGTNLKSLMFSFCGVAEQAQSKLRESKRCVHRSC